MYLCVWCMYSCVVCVYLRVRTKILHGTVFCSWTKVIRVFETSIINVYWVGLLLNMSHITFSLLLSSQSISSSGRRAQMSLRNRRLSSATPLAAAIVPNVSVMSFSHLCLGFPRLLFPATIPCIIVFSKPSWRVMCKVFHITGHNFVGLTHMHLAMKNNECNHLGI